MTRDAVERYAFAVAKRLRAVLPGSRVFANEDALGYGTASVTGNAVYERLCLALQHNGNRVEARLDDAEDDIRRWGERGAGMMPVAIWRTSARDARDRVTTRLCVLDELRGASGSAWAINATSAERDVIVTLDLDAFVEILRTAVGAQ